MVNRAADGQNGPQKNFAADLENAVDINISAGGAVQLKAAGITVNAPDELSFYYG